MLLARCQAELWVLYSKIEYLEREFAAEYNTGCSGLDLIVPFLETEVLSPKKPVWQKEEALERLKKSCKDLEALERQLLRDHPQARFEKLRFLDEQLRLMDEGEEKHELRLSHARMTTKLAELRRAA